MLRSFLFFIAAVFGALAPLQGHQVDTVEFEFQQLKGIWRLHGEMDIAYMLPETRWVQDAGPLDRREVMKAPPKELERIRRETEKTLRKYLTLSHAGKPLSWRIEFPDFNKKPFALPPEFGGFALLTVNLVVDEQTTLGEFRVHWSSKEKATLIILDELSNDGVPIAVEPGGSIALLNVKKAASTSPAKPTTTHQKVGTAPIVTERIKHSAFLSWLWSGFLHVIPRGLDHMLFILGLYLAVLAFKPMLWQSLLFTLAHSITLGACAIGWLPHWEWVEVFIAVTIAYIAIENLFLKKISKRRYITVFVFGLVHGLGFASVFAEQVRSVPDDKLLKPLLGFNLGVEIAQIVIILVAALIFSFIKKKKTREFWQKAGTVMIALAGLIWIIQRVFSVDLTFGIL